MHYIDTTGGNITTVEPVLKDHPGRRKKWSLKTGGCLIEGKMVILLQSWR